MKRVHIHLQVDDLQTSIRFYQALFAGLPDVIKQDYAKWLVHDPALNFTISTTKGREGQQGISHVGLQFDDGPDLEAVHTRLREASVESLPQPNAQCCYALSDKYWLNDPDQVRWELFHTHGESAVYGETAEPAAPCCG
ncbi:MAG: ArsI/CadI family heavy metal resistance metalloenzyme [Wenzhouxiangellaceae bacterium]